MESLSVVIPLFNERENIPDLYARVTEALTKLGRTYEVICVNDGSSDGTEEALAEISARDPLWKVLSFRRNAGQTAAMMAGFDHASNDIIIPIDGDLQNDPDDIGILLAKLGEGYDVVSGWRKNRKDNPLIRNLPSRIANRLISYISGVELHDYGCTLKAYRREVLQNVRLYGEMHRFVPIYASWQGAKVCEIPVSHHARKYGKSKYGLERTLKVILDLIVIKFLANYETKPIHVFGLIGSFSVLAAILSGVLALYLRIFHDISLIQTPLPLLAAMTFLVGIICILMGLLAEIMMRTYFEGQQKTIYLIKSKTNF